MKNLLNITIVTLCLILTTLSLGQFRGSGVVVKGKDYRMGLSFPVAYSHPKRMKSFSLNAWALTDARTVDHTYLGAGLSYPLLSSKNTSLSVTGGWSADFTSLRHVTNAQWGVGVMGTLRF